MMARAVQGLLWSAALLCVGSQAAMASDVQDAAAASATSAASAESTTSAAAAAASASASAAASASASASASGKIVIIEKFESPQLHNSRSLRIYLPAGYDDHPQQRYPVLYMHDAQNLFDAATASYGTEWGMATTMNRLVAAGSIEPVIVVGIDNTADRIAEYTPCCDPKHGGGKLDAYESFILDTVKPYVDRTLRTQAGREHSAIMGSSLGGIASVHIAERHADVFSMAAGLSSSFWWNEQTMVKHVPPHVPVRFYLDAGTDNDGLEDTIAMRDAMLAAGYRLGSDLYFYTMDGGIHNEKSWAARVQLPLLWFFGARPASR